jgi:hypothetical protein
MFFASFYEVDDVKDIHNKALALELYEKLARNVEAEDRCYQIRMRAARKPGELSKKIEKASGAGGHNRLPAQAGERKQDTLEKAGISTQQASEWERLAAVPQDEFETALATKSVRDLIDKPTPISGDALLFIGTMRDFERRGYLARAPCAPDKPYDSFTAPQFLRWKRC